MGRETWHTKSLRSSTVSHVCHLINLLGCSIFMGSAIGKFDLALGSY